MTTNFTSVASRTSITDPLILHKEGYTSKRYRVSAPPLQLLPLQYVKVSPLTAEKRALNSIIPQIEQFLLSNLIEVDDGGIDLFYTLQPGESSLNPDSLKIVINAAWNELSSEPWLLTVSKIRELLMSREDLKDVKVKMIAFEAEAERPLDVIEVDHALVRAWPAIRLDIHKIL
ncbi:hypothetical protein MMC14_007773 [Varicellaria rhodocarpa]|nr:hypothetical protein [Varicellaria rhodocarpa]